MSILKTREKDKEVGRNKEVGRENIPLDEYVPNTDVFESDKSYLVISDLPGVSKEGLEIKLDGDILSIEGEVDEKHKGHYARIYKRRFQVNPESIDSEGVRANISQGLLKVTLPKSLQAKAKQITINAD